MTNTRTLGPVEIGTRPYLHWRLELPAGFRVMRTPTTLMVYRADGNTLLRMPGGRPWWMLRDTPRGEA